MKRSVLFSIVVIVLNDPTITTINHEKIIITIVLNAVAKEESVVFIPHLLITAVIPAKKAERHAKIIHF